MWIAKYWDQIYIALLAILCLYLYLAKTRPSLAFLTSALPCLFFCFYLSLNNYITETEAIALAISILIMPVTFAAIIYLHRNEEKDHWTVVWCRWIFTFLSYAAQLIILTAIFQPLGPIIWVVIISLHIQYKSATRYANTLGIISTIGVAIRQNLPLATALETASSKKKDKQSRVLRGISRWLTQGYSLSESISRGYPKCPSEILAIITVSEKIGQLPQTIRTIEADMIAKADETKRVQPSLLTYPLVVLAAAFVIVLGLWIFIIPTFAEVLFDLSDGKVFLPEATRLLLGFSDLMVSHIWFWAITCIIVLIIAGFLAYIRISRRKPKKLSFILRLTDLARWYFPFIGWFERNYSLLQTVGLLRISLNAGYTVDKAIANTLELDINYYFKKRLTRWLQAIEQGANISSSARQARLGSSIAWAFDEKTNQGNTPVILETLEEFYRNNYNYKANIAKSIMCPCMILFLGAVVGFVVYAMFLPMVAITNFLVSDITP